MNDAWTKIKIWTKLSLIGLALLFILLFVVENHWRSVDVWLFDVHTMSVLELLVGTFLFGVAATLLARPTYRTLREIALLLKKTPSPPPPSAPPVPDSNPTPKP